MAVSILRTSCLLASLALASGIVLRGQNSTLVNKQAANSTVVLAVKGNSTQAPTFEGHYTAYASGPGIWKWSNALHAYQRHFGGWSGQPVNLAEVGVQSGGSIQMWKAVFGASAHIHGLDINPACTQFVDAQTTVTIGDQADVNMWNGFFTSVSPTPLDILIDDGGHEPQQMLVTLEQAYPHTNPGGFVVIEDIHGQNYIQSFFTPAASYLAAQAQAGTLDSVHVYPFLMVAQKVPTGSPLPPSALTFTGQSVVVSSFEQMWAEVPKHPGGHIILENPGWGNFHTAQGLTNFFALFGSLHDFAQHDEPLGCATTPASTCTAFIANSPMQASITGIHVYATRLVVEVAGGQVLIQAVRRGDKWLGYGF
jgi:hypothetical protein